MKYLVLSFVIIAVILACNKDKIQYEPTPYELKIPSHFPDMIIPDDNPMTVEGVELGRHLFYEVKLSGDNSMSCASCHSPQNAFSDPNQYSTGIDGIQGTRNSMALINLGWEDFFFWDGRSSSLEEQILIPVEDPIEMHDTWQGVVAELSASDKYKNMFYKAFGTPGVDKTRAAKAIAQFLRTMISGSSGYDLIYKDENNIPMTAEEQAAFAAISLEAKAGFNLFNSLNGADCLHCHNGPLARVKKFSNNGLDATFTDLGRGAVTGNPNDNGKFKVPTLRNIAFTAPYMHDGRFATLDEVITHYSFGIEQSPTIDPLIEFASVGGVQLDAFEREILLEFLQTFTDESFMNNPDFTDPN